MILKAFDVFKMIQKLFFIISVSVSVSVSCVHYAKRHKCHHAHSSARHGKEELPSSLLNQIIKNLSFFPLNGQRFRLSELKDIKAIVIVMREKDCPISEKYGPRLVRFEKEYSQKGILFIYNYVGQVRPESSARSDLKRFGFKGPYVIDKKQTVTNALNVQTTGDVFLLTAQRRLIYRGPLDDQYHLLKSALKPRNNYVLDILQNIVSGKKIESKEMPAPGCVISRPLQ